MEGNMQSSPQVAGEKQGKRQEQQDGQVPVQEQPVHQQAGMVTRGGTTFFIPYNQMIPTTFQRTKTWHYSITLDLRLGFVKRLLPVAPWPYPVIMSKQYMNDLVTHAKDLEAGKYEMANSRSEYCEMMDDMIFTYYKQKIESPQTRKEEKRRARKRTASGQILPRSPSQASEMIGSGTSSNNNVLNNSL